MPRSSHMGEEGIDEVQTRSKEKLDSESSSDPAKEYVIPKRTQVASEGADKLLRSFWDPNFSPLDRQPRLPASLELDSSSSPASPAPSTLEEDSPFPEVQTSVHPTDHPYPTSTPRAWMLGILFSILLPGINQFFFYRTPNVRVQGIVAQLLAHPLGLALARLPWGGEWNPKEHTLVRFAFHGDDESLMNDARYISWRTSQLVRLTLPMLLLFKGSSTVKIGVGDISSSCPC